MFLYNKKIDVCLLSETHLTKQTFVKIRGYSIYRADHPADKARGGAAVIIKEGIKHHEEIKIEAEMMQVATIVVFIKRKEFKLSAIYCPPRYNMKKENYLHLFKALGNTFIIGGDFNAKNTFWGSRLTTTKGKELYNAGKQMKCCFHSSGTPTYWPSDAGKLPDLIDFFITKGIADTYVHVEEDNEIFSDHTPVFLMIGESLVQNTDPPQLTSKRTRWEEFRRELDCTIQLQVPLKTPYQLEQEVDIFVTNIQQAAWNNTPTKSKKSANNIWYPEQIYELIKEKRKVRKIWQHTRAPKDKTKLNQLCNKLKHMLKEARNNNISKYLRGLSAEKETEYSLWKATKSIKRPKIPEPPIRKDDGTWARSDKEKAHLFAEHLEKIFQPLHRQTENENITSMSKRDEEEIQLVSLRELKAEIKDNLNPRKTPGYDLITGEVLKELPEKALMKLLHLINAAIRLKYVPAQWKVAEVIMIPKVGKAPNDKKSYRPISLLPTISKLFEKLLLKRLKHIIDERKLIPEHQFGFRQKHSTVDQVHRITNVIENALEKKQICSGIFLDVAQAFDRVWHKGLIYKLHRDIPWQYAMLITSYLTDRHFRVKHGSEYSDLKKISAGVPQGSVLGPVLYLLYTGDVPQHKDTITATFADDTAILASDETIEAVTNKLQCAINKVNIWTKKWRIQLNELKSTYVIFTNKNVKPLPVKVNAQVIPFANTAKYLGLTLDTKLRWRQHVKNKKDELNIKYRKMNWLLGRNSDLQIHNKLLIYNQVLKPVWTYGIQLWGCTKKNNSKLIQTFQNKVLRSIVNAPWYIRNDTIHRDLKVETVEEVIKKYAVKHVSRLQQHSNLEILKLCDKREEIRRLKRTKPFDLIN